MTNKFWNEIREIVNEALDMPTEMRSEYLDRVCNDRPELRTEVDSLLAVEVQAKDFIETPAVPVGQAVKEKDDAAEAEEKIETIGPYRILRKVGEGGMARVYEGRRLEEVQIKVAIKVIKPRLARREVLWRFRHERRILASLDHRNIARLRDAGTTDEGLPYFVMDLVDGVRLDAYCDEKRLSVKQRVELFLKVCSAVSYAHEKMVVHRDLKPGNILVDPQGEPKLLDFGIAKLLEADQEGSMVTTIPMTEEGAMPLTPSYASPEQFQGRTVTATSDVYSLGVVLYELLTGHNPHRIERPEYSEYRKAVLEDEPSRPSEIVTRTEKSWRSRRLAVNLTPEEVSATRARSQKDLRKNLTGDLDCIVLKALRKPPEDRYGSVAALAADLRAFLQGLPVEARRTDLMYRVTRLLKVHRWKLAGAAVVMALLTALAFQSWETIKLKEQKSTIQSFVSLLESAEKGTIDNRLSEMVAGGLPVALDQINEVAVRLEQQEGNYPLAERLHRQILETAIEVLGPEDERVPVSLNNLAANLTHQGRYEEAEQLLIRGLELKKQLYGSTSSQVLISLLNLATLYQNTDRLGEAEEMAIRIRGLAEELHTNFLPVVENNEAQLKLKQGRFREAEAAYLEVLGLLGDPSDPVAQGRKARTLRNLAVALQRQGRTEEALATARQSVELAYGAFADWHLAEAESVLGWCLAEEGDSELAEVYLTRSYEVLARAKGDGARETREARQKLGEFLSTRASRESSSTAENRSGLKP